MRPQSLYPLFAPIGTLAGVGPKVGPAVERAAGERVIDVLWHLPIAVINRNPLPAIADAVPGEMATLSVRVQSHHPPQTPRRPYRVRCSDERDSLILTFFKADPAYLRRILPVGEERIVSGVVDTYGDELQMVHPDHIVEATRRDSIATVEPVYRLSAGLTPWTMARVMRGALACVPTLEEWIDPTTRERAQWLPWTDAVCAVHAPTSEADIAPSASARARLAYDELLANQLALALVRRQVRTSVGRARYASGTLASTARIASGFTLTRDQEQALAEIRQDMAAEDRMLRLLQGDVGSGKTIVAVLAMLDAVESGGQAALMAPTEVLARQHLATIAPLARAAGIECALMTGRDRAKERRETLSALAAGEIGIVVGTHALIGEDVAFRDLALVVIDEQHRFGVHQRLLLADKGNGADILVMSATPIPRTLVMTAYGDLDVSRLQEKPPGRQPIDTRVISAERLDDVIGAIARRLDQGAQVFWVCPLVEESDAQDVTAAEARFRHLRDHFGARVGLIHGRLKGEARDEAIASFQSGETRLLVATTVIEVGVDVPSATTMVVEHAERFGLAQLHQLRGRIGRGSEASVCLFVYQPPLTENAHARLAILRETDDGFRIAEEDLRLRGAGEILGVRQSGLPAFHIADPIAHADLMRMARDDARLILEKDPTLMSPRGQALRTLLYLFERDAAIAYARIG